MGLTDVVLEGNAGCFPFRCWRAVFLWKYSLVSHKLTLLRSHIWKTVGIYQRNLFWQDGKATLISSRLSKTAFSNSQEGRKEDAVGDITKTVSILNCRDQPRIEIEYLIGGPYWLNTGAR